MGAISCSERKIRSGAELPAPDAGSDAFRRAVQKAAAQKWDHHYVNFLTDNTGMTGLMLFIPGVPRQRPCFPFPGPRGRRELCLSRRFCQGCHRDTHPRPWTSLSLRPISLPWRIPTSKGTWTGRALFTPRAPMQHRREGWWFRPRLTSPLVSCCHCCYARRDLFAPNAYLFLAGDLNYRTSNIGPSIREIEHFPRCSIVEKAGGFVHA
jgi:hypothetical protein